MDLSARNPASEKQGYLFEVPVQKWSRTERAFKNRLLALTRSSVVEMDVATRYCFRSMSCTCTGRAEGSKLQAFASLCHEESCIDASLIAWIPLVGNFSQKFRVAEPLHARLIARRLWERTHQIRR